MELNYFALLGMTQLVAPHMRARRSGVIVNVSSIGGKSPLPWCTLYSATKYAVSALTEGLRVELRRDGVRTMLVCPGYVMTGFQEQRASASRPPGVVRARRFAITAGRVRRGHPPRRGARRAHRGRAARRLDSGGASAPVPAAGGGAHGGVERDRMNLKLKHTPGIYLVGFMGSGKSTVGRSLAAPAGVELLRYRRRNRAGREARPSRRSSPRAASRVPPHRSGDGPAARPLDRARPARGGGAGRRRFRRPRPTASCSATTASRCGWIARSKPWRAAWRSDPHRPLARDPEQFQALYQARREFYAPGRLAHSHRRATTRPRPWKPSWPTRCSDEPE